MQALRTAGNSSSAIDITVSEISEVPIRPPAAFHPLMSALSAAWCQQDWLPLACQGVRMQQRAACRECLCCCGP
jgi:hypothetical protein